MMLRAFAAHPAYRRHPGALAAATLLKGRFFLADKYNDRRASSYWLKFQYPFWWSNLLTSLDTLARMAYHVNDQDVRSGLDWFIAHQDQDGLWQHGYGAGKGAHATKRWVTLGVCRVFRRFHEHVT
jgi:hypothetical protein